jgi:hypothetical protein
MRTMRITLVFVSLLCLLACNIRKNNENPKEVSKKIDFQENNNSSFDIEAFVENPFSDNVEVPKILSENIDFMNYGNYKTFTRSERIVKSSNGDYKSYVFEGPFYHVEFSSVGAGNGKTKMLRTILTIDKKDIELKNGFIIGQDILNVKKLLPTGVNEYTIRGSHYFSLSGNEETINFIEKSEKLRAVHIIIGD